MDSPDPISANPKSPQIPPRREQKGGFRDSYTHSRPLSLAHAPNIPMASSPSNEEYYYYDLVSPSMTPTRRSPSPSLFEVENLITPMSSPRETFPVFSSDATSSPSSWIRIDVDDDTSPLTPTLRSPPRETLTLDGEQDGRRNPSPPRSPDVTFPLYLDPRQERPSYMFTTPPLPPPRGGDGHTRRRRQ